MRLAGPAAALLALAACAPSDDPPYADEQNQAGERRIVIANPHHDALTRLSPDNQRLTMLRAVRQSGNRCRRVDNAGYQEEYRNMRMWVAHCGVENKSWAVFLAANGDLQVRDCAHAGQLELPRCAPLPPPLPGANLIQEGAADNAFRTRLPVDRPEPRPQP